MFKTVVRKYVLNPVYVVAAYALFALSLLFYTNPFESLDRFVTPSLMIMIPLYLGMRFLDDYSDYQKDFKRGKAYLNQNVLIVCWLVSCVTLIAVCFATGRWAFVLMALLIVGVYRFNLEYVKPFVTPLVFALVLLYEYGFHVSNGLILGLSFVVSILFAVVKGRKGCKERGHFGCKGECADYMLEQVGGKAYNLFKLNIKNTPDYYPIKAEYLNPPNMCELRHIVDKFCKPGKLYAVRSSAVDEDSAANSFAGVHDTFLNVKKGEVLEKILAVVESAHSDVALKYRKENGLDVENIQIAVLLQEMVDADFAGVLNTINPVTNNVSETVISVTQGLGDKLVDGTVDGSTYYLDGKKVEVNGPDILNKKVLKGLLDLANELRVKTNRFQDCEFAVKNDKVYFLQSRAITTYDVDSHGMTLLIDNSNLIESYYGMTSPLTHSFAHEIYAKVYAATGKLLNIDQKIVDECQYALDHMLYSYEGKLYYNLNSWYQVNSVLPSKSSTSYMESMMGVKAGDNSLKRVKMGLWDICKVACALLPKFRNIDKLSDQFVENFNAIVNPYYGKNLDHLSMKELVALYEEIDSKIIKEFTIPILNDVGVMMNFGRLKDKVQKYPNADELLAFAVNNDGNVESAKNATEFIKIVEFIRADGSLRKDFEGLSDQELSDKYLVEGALVGGAAARADVAKMLKDYIHDYGPRVINELKLETVTMIEEPALIFGLIREGLKNPRSGETAAASNVEIPRELRKLAEKAKHFIQNRERLRLRRTYVFSVIRNIFLSCGKNLEREGKIGSYRDVFYLKKNEIFYGEGADGGNDADLDYRKLVAERKAQEEIDSKKPYYNRIAFFGDKVLPITFVSPKGLTGLPSGHGVVKGKVCVMETKDDTFEPGSIIVTKRTDPGWISLFPLACGLIVEHGSMLSHSFVVAREMKLPCIVGVSGITQLLKTGDVVTLDASKGEVTIETV